MKVLIVTKDSTEAATMRRILDDIIEGDSMNINYDSSQDAFFAPTLTGSRDERVIYLLLGAAELIGGNLQRIIDYLKDLDDWPVVCSTRLKKG